MRSAQANADIYSHQGVVSRIDGDSVVVSLDGNVHCETCRAKGACGISDSPSREVEILDSGGSYRLNEPVQVVLKRDLGHKAVFWAYVFPFLLMLLTLLGASLFYAEWVAGVLSVLVLVPYYLMVYVLRNYFRSTFRISIVRN